MKFEFSAGGIVFKPIRQAQGKEDFLILVAQHSQHHGWVFPKGLIDDHSGAGGHKETKEEAALREVEEETGVIGKILSPLDPISFWYVWEKEKIKKTVYYFIMEFVSGDITKHDLEMENVEWLEADKVEERLSFKSDKKVWAEAREIIVNI
ncbi:MAG TPA: NUDIX domain-containing protein [Candidatus Limnocylindrales bacterium]|nr:NUDIX domain-containing protein [Candidatus Limnocylindrales bacterium]